MPNIEQIDFLLFTPYEPRTAVMRSEARACFIYVNHENTKCYEEEWKFENLNRLISWQHVVGERRADALLMDKIFR